MSKIGSLQDHKNKVYSIANSLEDLDRYDLIQTRVEYYEYGDHINPVGELDIFGVIYENKHKELDIFEIKTSESDYCLKHGKEQLYRAKDFFTDYLKGTSCSFDEIRTFLIAGDKKPRKIE